MNAPEHIPLERPAIDGAQYLPINLCEAVSFNPRKRFDQTKLDDLANSIEKMGVMQPVLARPKPNAKRGGALYEIVAGERRLRACKMVAERRKESDIAVIPAVVRDLSDFEARELATTENLQRDDLHPLEEAEGYEGLLLRPVTGGEFKPPRARGYTVDELAARIGKSRGYVFGRLKLLALIPEAREAFFENKLSASVALMVARMPAKVQEKALPQLLIGWAGEPYSHRQASEFLHKNYMLALKSAVFDIADASLVPKAGSCHACPKRTGAAPDLFDDVKSADTCTDPACFEAKAKAHGEKQLEQAREKGLQVLTGQAAKKVMPYGEHSLSNTGHLNLDKPAEELTGTRKNLRSLLGDEFKATLVKGDHMEQPIAVATEADVKAALKEKGLLKPSTKGAPGRPAKALTVEDIKKQRDKRLHDLTLQRAPGALWKHLQSCGQEGLSTYAYVQMLMFMDQVLCTGLEELLEVAGLHKKGTGRLSDQERRKLLEQQPEDVLANLIFVSLACDSIENDVMNKGQLRELAADLDWPLEAFTDELAHEVDAAVRDEIDALKKAVPKGTSKVAKKTGAAAPTARYRNAETGEAWSGRGLQPKWLKVALERGKTLAEFEVNRAPSGTGSTPPSSAAAQGAKTAQKTPEQALAEAVAKGTKAAAAPKKTVQKDKPAKLHASAQAPKKATGKAKATNQKDKAAAPPTAQIATVAAWPFPKGAAA
jgi:ParB/RepB/Spo0J family partition protein